MALPKLLIPFLCITLSLSRIDPSSCQQVVKGKLSCLDCPLHYNLAGIKVIVKCDKVKKLAMATSDEDGVFKVEMPSDNINIPRPPTSKCDAKVFGGPKQLYAHSKTMVSSVVKGQGDKFYTISTPLAFYKTWKKTGALGSSKTIDLPIPAEWGLAPTSYYVPFFPIIGIP